MICGHSVDDILPVFTGFFNINVNNFINFMCITNLTKAKKVFFFVFFEENICNLGCKIVSIVPLSHVIFAHQCSLKRKFPKHGTRIKYNGCEQNLLIVNVGRIVCSVADYNINYWNEALDII